MGKISAHIGRVFSDRPDFNAVQPSGHIDGMGHSLIIKEAQPSFRDGACHTDLDDLKADLMTEFMLMGCDFSEQVIEGGSVNVQFSCPGRTAVRGICRLTMTQYSNEGEVLNVGRIEE